MLCSLVCSVAVGGREFRLTDGIGALTAHNTKYQLALGASLGPDYANATKVAYSTGMGDNDPLFNAFELNDIDYVYLRKETANSTPKNDDVLGLRRVFVKMMDATGAMRGF